MLYYAEDNATQHIEALLGGLYKGCRDEEIGVVKEVLYRHNKYVGYTLGVQKNGLVTR